MLQACPIDSRKQVLNHSNKPEKLTFPEKIEITLFEARISAFNRTNMAHKPMTV